MSVRRQYPGKLPEDAVTISYEEALNHQLNLIHDWPKTSEVWPLRSGISILGIAASSAGMYINSHYRRKLKLRAIGLMTTYLPIVVLPGISSTLLHKTLITYNLVMERTDCSLCLQARSAAMQATVGFLYPLILAPLGNFMYATRHGTYRLPDIVSDFRGSIKMLIKFARPIGTQLSFIFVGQLLLGSYFTYLEAKSYYTVKQQMDELEREFDNRI